MDGMKMAKIVCCADTVHIVLLPKPFTRSVS